MVVFDAFDAFDALDAFIVAFSCTSMNPILSRQTSTQSELFVALFTAHSSAHASNAAVPFNISVDMFNIDTFETFCICAK